MKLSISIPLFIVLCFSAAIGQTAKPTPDPVAETTRILKEQIERLERKLEEMKKEEDALLEQERAVRAERRAVESTTPSASSERYFDDYPRRHYLPYSHYSPYVSRRYYPRTYYPRYYYPRRYFLPLRTYRRY